MFSGAPHDTSLAVMMTDYGRSSRVLTICKIRFTVSRDFINTIRLGALYTTTKHTHETRTLNNYFKADHWLNIANE